MSDYKRIIHDELTLKYQSVLDMSKITIENLKSIFRDIYFLMNDIFYCSIDHTKILTEELICLNNTEVNITDEFNHMNDLIASYVKYKHTITIIISVLAFVIFIMCLIMIFNCKRKKVIVLDKMMEDEKISKLNNK